MSYQELISSNFSINLKKEIESLDLSKCSNSDLYSLKSLAMEIKQKADVLTLEEEFVGETYNNLDVLNPKITMETAKRKIITLKCSNF